MENLAGMPQLRETYLILYHGVKIKKNISYFDFSKYIILILCLLYKAPTPVQMLLQKRAAFQYIITKRNCISFNICFASQ